MKAEMDDDRRVVKFILQLCRAVVRKDKEVADAIRQIREFLAENPNHGGIIFDTLFSFSYEKSSSQSPAYKDMLEQVCDELLPRDVLSADIYLLGADEQQTKSRVVKCKTRLYYKQVKFNLFREESEGYAKLITELLTIQPSTTHEGILLTVESLIGQFNLDPNRVVDVILDCFECSLRHKNFFIHLLKKFILNKDDLRDILTTKFAFCKNTEYTSTSLYKVASLICQEGLVDVNALFTMIAPTQTEVREETKVLGELIRQRCSRAEVVSSTAAAYSANAAGSGAGGGSSLLAADQSLAANESAMDVEPSQQVAAVSLSAALLSQQTEDRKLAAGKFDDVLAKNQKLGLVLALLEHGAWELAKELLDKLPEVYPMGLCHRIAVAIANIVDYQIEPFYRQKCCATTASTSSRMQENSWERFTYSPMPVVEKWSDLFTHTFPLIRYLGPYIGARHSVAIKLIRLLSTFQQDGEAARTVVLDDQINAERQVVELLDVCLLPATSLCDSNYAYCEELWSVLGRLPYQDRYRLYDRWKNVHPDRCWDLSLQRGRVHGMTKYIVKRLSKETAKVMGRQLGKLSHTFPMVVFDYLLDKIQDFQNFIEPVVDAIRFMSLLEFDVLSYCLIESLAASEKQDFKLTDLNFSQWLSSLAMFAANVYKKYPIDFAGILQYVVNQLKQAKSMDLIVLREIVATVSGVEHSYDITQEHLEAQCGGETLRNEVGYSLTSVKANRKAIARLKEALLKNDLFESLCILVGQQKNHIIYVDTRDEIPLKLATQMLDHCQETFLQFFYFVRSNLKPEEYARRMSSAPALITDFRLPAECAICLVRPIYMNRINGLYEQSKRNHRDSAGKPAKPDATQKTAMYVEAFASVQQQLEEEVFHVFPEMFWSDLTARLYSTFWILSISDISTPTAAYEREIERLKVEASKMTSSSSKKMGREEERLRALEQRLVEESRKQVEHIKRIEEVIRGSRELFFAQQQNRSSQMLRFLQSCVLPRAIFSDIDAIYCAEFITKLHAFKVDMFQTIIFFDKMMTDVTPILCGLSERETSCFGLFLNKALELIMRWHSSKEVFNQECLGFPGCIIKIRKQDSSDSSPIAFTYDHYRSLCHKWQIRLAKSLSFMLANPTDTYVMIRNALTFSLKVLPNFPILQKTIKTIESVVTLVRDNEKGKRSDLNLLASSYLVQLAKRSVKHYTEEEFHNVNFMKTVTTQQQKQSATGAAASAPTGARRIASTKGSSRSTAAKE